MAQRPSHTPLHGWSVLALRPATELRTLARKVRAAGGRLHCLPLWQIEPLAAEAALAAALAAPRCLFTSPNAVRCADRLCALADYPGLALAVGSGTAARLRRCGVRQVRQPGGAMTAEALLAMTELQATSGPIGLVTAPGGRQQLATVLAGRGCSLRVAEVYRRRPIEPPRWRLRQWAKIGQALLLVSSGEALQAFSARFEPHRQDWQLIASSPRLAALAAELGWRHCRLAANASPAALLEAAVDHAKQEGFR